MLKISVPHTVVWDDSDWARLRSMGDVSYSPEYPATEAELIARIGEADIIVGADLFRQSTGRAYVYWGSELSGPSPKPGRIFTGENPGEWFSMGLACGDVNNDDCDDLVIGAHGYKAGSNQGRAYLYYGGPDK